jgi:hypothetical protein
MSRYNDSEYDKLEDAVKRALDLNEELSDGDNGISFIENAEGRKAQIGNGEMRAFTHDEHWNLLDITDDIILTIISHLRWK